MSQDTTAAPLLEPEAPAFARLLRLFGLRAHEIVLAGDHQAVVHIAGLGDDGNQDAPVSRIIRPGGTQVWFLGEHLVAALADQG